MGSLGHRFDAPTWIRTRGLLLRRESLYPAELSGPDRRIESIRSADTSARREVYAVGGMVNRGVDGVRKGYSAWRDKVLGTGDGYEAFERRRRLRRLAIAIPVLLVGLAIGIGGFAIGQSQVVDADQAQEKGFEAGREQGIEVGAREGYDEAFRSARRDAFAAAYGDSYRSAYLAEFAAADLPAPENVEVPEP